MNNNTHRLLQLWGIGTGNVYTFSENICIRFTPKIILSSFLGVGVGGLDTSVRVWNLQMGMIFFTFLYPRLISDNFPVRLRLSCHRKERWPRQLLLVSSFLFSSTISSSTISGHRTRTEQSVGTSLYPYRLHSLQGSLLNRHLSLSSPGLSGVKSPKTSEGCWTATLSHHLPQ